MLAAGSDNPLGLYAMRLGFPRYLIHGTNKPYGIGMQISHGCVQLYPEDIEVLFKKALVGMPVRIIHQPYLTAWHQNMLYLEATEPLQKWAPDKPKLKKRNYSPPPLKKGDLSNKISPNPSLLKRGD